jgi:hypothetical protein
MRGDEYLVENRKFEEWEIKPRLHFKIERGRDGVGYGFLSHAGWSSCKRFRICKEYPTYSVANHDLVFIFHKAQDAKLVRSNEAEKPCLQCRSTRLVMEGSKGIDL